MHVDRLSCCHVKLEVLVGGGLAIVHDVVVDVTSIFLILPQVGVQVQVVGTFVENDGLAGVEAKVLVLGCFEGCSHHNLGGVCCDCATDGRALDMGTALAAISTVVSVRKRGASSALMGNLVLILG